MSWQVFYGDYDEHFVLAAFETEQAAREFATPLTSEEPDGGNVHVAEIKRQDVGPSPKWRIFYDPQHPYQSVYPECPTGPESSWRDPEDGSAALSFYAPTKEAAVARFEAELGVKLVFWKSE